MSIAIDIVPENASEKQLHFSSFFIITLWQFNSSLLNIAHRNSGFPIEHGGSFQSFL